MKGTNALWKKLLAAVGIILGVVVLAVVFLLGWLSLGEYKPEEQEAVEILGEPGELLYPGASVRVVTWNVGYGALGDNADFFMDGGTGVRTADEERIMENMDAILDELKTLAPDVIFLQEVDEDSDRTYGIYQTSFAYNFRVLFVPYPVPPIGGVNSGVMTLCAYPVSAAERMQLPCPFAWPVRLANLKRCMLVERVPVSGTDRELVLVNVHLEAYDSGEGKLAQTKMLREFLEAEAEAGNYVIAGGDMNQIFSSVDDPFAARVGTWRPGVLDVSEFSEGWQFAMDTSAPSCRSLDRPLEGADPEDFTFYLIDGFIVSKELAVTSLETQSLGFRNSDHNPVLLEVRLPVLF